MRNLIFSLILFALSFCGYSQDSLSYDVVIVGGTPGGIMSGISAARMGKTALILERTAHIGGLPANGLGATDIATRGATTGLFLEFVQRIKGHYVNKYGPDSQQVKDCSDGYHFEPSVAEKVFEEMLAEQPLLRVAKMRQFDAMPENVIIEKDRIISIKILNRETNEIEEVPGKIFIDATYEGDLAAAAGVPFRLGREGKNDFSEPGAGRIYKYWNGHEAEGSTFQGDNAVQAYNYRLCITVDPDNRMSIQKPISFNREEYVSLIEDVWSGNHTGIEITKLSERQKQENEKRRKRGLQPIVHGQPSGIQRMVNRVKIPNEKYDANNQHLAFISTDLPEENWPWPTSGWDWRDRYSKRLKDYTLGLLWFAQNEPELPKGFRKLCGEYGLAKDEYIDNDNFPRQVYVREGRRIRGKYLFKAHDALPLEEGARPFTHSSSITASHYALDSHATRKREAGRAHLDGFLSYPTKPYTVPYGVIVPVFRQNLLIPVPVSATHIGYSTLRMEPCWMALGQAAGIAASLAVTEGHQNVNRIQETSLQWYLLKSQATLIYYEDVNPEDEYFDVVQSLGLKGYLPGWTAELDKPISQETAIEWTQLSGLSLEFKPGETPRKLLLKEIYDHIGF
ncbi:MAG: FAD-dependent oxidoreductase [Bacteroidetes bacterium]|nr:FAD-dependent oxidoreductase [Bacteroidota bacterium]